MFIYKPLQGTIKKSGKSFIDMCNAIGVKPSIMRLKMNNSEPVSMETLHKICCFFRCQPGEVISWEPIDLDKKSKVDWKAVEKNLNGKNFEYLAKECGLNRTAIYKMRSRDSYVREWIIDTIAKKLGCTVGELKKDY